MKSIETFQIDRLIASRINPNDYDELCRMHRDSRVMASLGGVRSDDETERFLREKMDQWETL